jgi:transcriptional regulator with XRE-family HTH domain
MSETSKLINGLKSELKTRGLTYKDLAQRLNLSEPSVKRLFAEESFTLERFAKACEVVGTSIHSILKTSDGRDDGGLAHLSLEQEEMLASDPDYFGVFHRLLHGYKMSYVQNRMQLSDAQFTRVLVALDKIGVIDLGPGNVVKFKTPRLIRWDNDGPLMKTYGEKVRQVYFKDPFLGPATYCRFLTGPLSDRVAIIAEDRLRKVCREIEDMWEWDMRSKPKDPRRHHGILVACKPWDW